MFFTATCRVLVLGIGLSAQGAWADPATPARGTALRSDMLDAVRPFATHDLGAPVEFVVRTLLAEGDRGFAMLFAQRPGGVPIDMAQIPLVIRDGEPPDLIDGPEVIAFLHYNGGQWQIVDYAVGATDVWWAGGPYCADYAAFLPAGACP